MAVGSQHGAHDGSGAALAPELTTSDPLTTPNVGAELPSAQSVMVTAVPVGSAILSNQPSLTQAVLAMPTPATSDPQVSMPRKRLREVAAAFTPSREPVIPVAVGSLDAVAPTSVSDDGDDYSGLEPGEIPQHELVDRWCKMRSVIVLH